MNFLLFLFIFLCLIGIQMEEKGKIYNDYLSREKTEIIKGIFVLLIFFSHFGQNINLKNDLNLSLSLLKSNQKQLIVAPFFFYMGYGLMKQSQKKEGYIKAYYKKILYLLARFDSAVLIYLIATYLSGERYSIKRIALSFIGYKNIENSNWYFFTTMILYLIFYFTFSYFKNDSTRVFMTSLFCSAVIYVMILFKRPDFWYNTIMAFPLGMLISYKEDIFKKIPFHYDEIYFSVLLFLFICFYYSYTRKGIILYEINVMVFCLIIVVLSMKFSIKNSLLKLLSEHAFSIYILQRLPMFLLKKYFDATNHIYIYFFCCFFCTIIISIIFDRKWNDIYLCYWKK